MITLVTPLVEDVPPQVALPDQRTPPPSVQAAVRVVAALAGAAPAIANATARTLVAARPRAVRRTGTRRFGIDESFDHGGSPSITDPRSRDVRLPQDAFPSLQGAANRHRTRSKVTLPQRYLFPASLSRRLVTVR